jgi:hypothetical protein
LLLLVSKQINAPDLIRGPVGLQGHSAAIAIKEKLPSGRPVFGAQCGLLNGRLRRISGRILHIARKNTGEPFEF